MSCAMISQKQNLVLTDPPIFTKEEALAFFVGALADVLTLRYPEHGGPKPI